MSGELSVEQMKELLPFISDEWMDKQAEAYRKQTTFIKECKRLEGELRTARSVASESARYRNRLQRRYDLTCVQCREASEALSALHGLIWASARRSRDEAMRRGKKGGVR